MSIDDVNFSRPRLPHALTADESVTEFPCAYSDEQPIGEEGEDIEHERSEVSEETDDTESQRRGGGATLARTLSRLQRAGADRRTPTPDECIQALSSDGSTNGQWTDDCDSENKSGSYAGYYTFTLTESADVTITLESDEDTILYLLSGAGKDGTALHDNDDHAAESDCAADLDSNTDSCITDTLDAGDYTIEATTYNAATTGDFTLTMEGLAQSGVTPEPPHTPGPSSGFVSVSAGRFHTCGVKTDGSVACWGRDNCGEATTPAGWSGGIRSSAHCSERVHAQSANGDRIVT